MAEYITNAQLKELENAAIMGDDAYHKLLLEYTGIEARPYTAYLYYDVDGNYVGNSEESTIYDLLKEAYVEVEDG